ncbi:hypothetical protein [Nitrosopumilus sp. b2]|uniref:hypothetical protein n=1 Tax=Nitrosopumilus sp. b2 TaxID=2109908 RepID=UPI0015F4F754|nr:hypothetical protein [Nitrosopumilus sp. b2]KAF6245196.1 hypothetical protein C6989_04500 [Nitrosopumilus sp. b2]
MVKVHKVGSRGTRAYEKDEGPQNWAGDAYRKVEQDKMKKVPKGKTLHLGRGVRTTKVKDLAEPKPRPSTEGMTRITNRGTGSRASKNKGTK